MYIDPYTITNIRLYKEFNNIIIKVFKYNSKIKINHHLYRKKLGKIMLKIF